LPQSASDLPPICCRNAQRAILTEAARGDLLTMTIFKNAVNGQLIPEARKLVERQYIDVREGHARVVALGHAGVGILSVHRVVRHALRLNAYDKKPYSTRK
jgi:hypothetical protein